MATIGLVLDCADPEHLATFWAAALGYDNAGSAGAYVLLRSPDDGRPQLLLQRVPEAKSAKNRMHLDIHVTDIEAEADRLVALGGRRVGSGREHGVTWIVMADPEGNELCVCDS